MDAARFTGRRAFVTGAGSGIGAAVARRLHAEGAASVMLADLRAEPVEALAGELGDRAAGRALDVRDEDAVRAAVAAAGEIDVLVNVAGIGSTTNAPDTDARASGRTSSPSTRAGRSCAASTPSRGWSSAAAARS